MKQDLEKKYLADDKSNHVFEQLSWWQTGTKYVELTEISQMIKIDLK